MRAAACLPFLLLGFAAPAAAADCAAALAAGCGSVKAKCGTFPCTSCQTCVITNSAALAAAGCSPQDELDYCSTPPPPPPPPPPGTCTFTDSRGDTYDLSLIPVVDGKYTKLGGHKSWYHVGVCGPPTRSADPKLGCQPVCADEYNCAHGHGLDKADPGVCQYDPDMAFPAAVEYNAGTEQSRTWADGPQAGQSVKLEFSHGSDRGGCATQGAGERRTTVIVSCDPCSNAEIAQVKEPETCHYQTHISSTAGCPTNKPLPTGNCPHLCDAVAGQCKKVPAGTSGASPTLAACQKVCVRPTPKPTPAPTPAPTIPPTPSPPIYSIPCIRVTHVLPVADLLDIQIVQQASDGERSFTWTNFNFGKFSNWSAHFEVGTGTVNVYASGTQQKLLTVTDIPLTPGPLVVAVKCPGGYTTQFGGCWPLGKNTQLGGSIETIAASFSPLTNGSKVRLFNLSPDTKKAGLRMNGESLFDSIDYGLSPPSPSWKQFPTQPTQFTAVDDASGGTVYTHTVAHPPSAPTPFTEWLIGNRTPSAPQFAARLLAVSDAPNNGLTCTGDR